MENNLQQKSRFQSPPNLPAFYTEALQSKTSCKSIETQTTSKCVVMKKSDLCKAKSPEIELNKESGMNEVSFVEKFIFLYIEET